MNLIFQIALISSIVALITTLIALMLENLFNKRSTKDLTEASIIWLIISGLVLLGSGIHILGQ